MESNQFEWNVRVYYEDTDCARVVYYANYLKFLERARTEWLRSLGWSQDKMLKELHLIFVVAGVDIKYREPARLDDELSVKCRVLNSGKASLVFEQEIWRKDELLISAQVKCGCLDSDTYKPKMMPKSLADQFGSK